jgi:transposase InsO family protein
MDLPLAISPVSPSAPSKVEWITLDQAAKLSGMSEGHLRRKCGDIWLAQGLARTRNEPGKRAFWEVRTDADPAFMVRTAPAVIASVNDLQRVSDTARRKAQERARIVTEWTKFVQASAVLGRSADQATADFLASMPEGQRVSRRTLFNWRESFSREGISGLIDGRAITPENGTSIDPFLAEVLRIWMSQTKKKVALCYDIAAVKARDCGWEICSARTARRFVEEYAKKNPGPAILAREGPSMFMDKIEPFITRDYSTLDSNEIWNADHHLFDVLVKMGEKTDPGTGEVTPIYRRPWLTAWQDVRSRKIVGWMIRDADPNTDAILEAFYYACVTHGIPRMAYTDNGRDFDAKALTGMTKRVRRALQHASRDLWKARHIRVTHDQEKLGGIYAALRIDHLHAWPYHGQSKPIERFFGTVEDRFGRLFDTYCGSSTDEKPEQLADMLDRGRGPTFDEFVDKFSAWLEADYHQRIHTGDAMDCTPDAAFAANLVSRRTVPDALLKVLVQPRIGPLKVSQNGVRWGRASYGAGDLNHLLGQDVFIRIDHHDVTRVSVWTIDDKPIAVVSANRAMPFITDKELLDAAVADKHRRTKAIKGAREASLLIGEDLSDTLFRLAEAKAQKRLPAPPAALVGDETVPPNIAPVRTSLEGALPFIQSQNERPLRNASRAPKFDLASAMEEVSLEAKRPAALPSLADIYEDE